MTDEIASYAPGISLRRHTCCPRQDTSVIRHWHCKPLARLTCWPQQYLLGSRPRGTFRSTKLLTKRRTFRSSRILRSVNSLSRVRTSPRDGCRFSDWSSSIGDHIRYWKEKPEGKDRLKWSLRLRPGETRRVAPDERRRGKAGEETNRSVAFRGFLNRRRPPSPDCMQIPCGNILVRVATG